MTPAARIAASIEVLDAWLGGVGPDAALRAWGRGHRFAGSGDRAAIRDHVFDAIRCRRSFAGIGGADTGRGLMIGALRVAGVDPSRVFGAGGHAPPALAAAEMGPMRQLSPQEALDCPDWLWPMLRADLGPEAEAHLKAAQSRAPIQLRVNPLRGDRDGAIAALAKDGIEAQVHAEVTTALTVTRNARRVTGSAAYQGGLVDLQDAHSQAVVVDLGDRLPAPARALDYCAGAGGKSLALAALPHLQSGGVVAHDVAPERMTDLPSRAARLGAKVALCQPEELEAAQRFDMVLCDAPCSGSGTWRRDPMAKWTLSRERLGQLTWIQDEVLDRSATLVSDGGVLVYVTCSVLGVENEARAEAFLQRTAGWSMVKSQRWPMGDGGDGFFRAIFARDTESR